MVCRERVKKDSQSKLRVKAGHKERRAAPVNQLMVTPDHPYLTEITSAH